MSNHEYVDETSESRGVHMHHQEAAVMVKLNSVKKEKKESITKPQTSGGKQEATFTFSAAMAGKVCIAGNFNNWDTSSMPMTKGKDGTWKVKLKLSPGNYEYKYFVDGAWAADQSGAELVPNPFGTDNCVMSIH